MTTKPERTEPEREPLTLMPTGGQFRDTMPPAATWATPLPPVLLERADTERVSRHAALIARAANDTREARVLAGRVERTRALDEGALHQAVAAGKKAPAAKAPALEQELHELERRLTAYPQAAAESGQALLVGIDDDDVAEALAAARARARRELEALPAIVAELASAIERVAKLGAEEEWLVALEAARIVPPFAAGEVLARTMEDARGLLPRLGENVRAELERTAAWASGDEAEPDQPTGFVVGELTYREARTMRRPEGGEGA